MVIDDDKILDSNVKDERSKNLSTTAAIYLIIIVAISAIPLFFIQGRFKIKTFTLGLLFNTIIPIGMASTVELYRKRKREKKEN